MSCRRVCRELLWLTRFGELGPSSAPHLDHLTTCRSCRDEVGFDRAMVQQLRIALAERIEGASPSAHAWEVILERTRQPAPPRSRWAWSSALGRMRWATAMVGTGLALVLALNMQVVTVSGPARDDSTSAAAEVLLTQVPRLPTGRTALVVLSRQGLANSSRPTRPDPESALMRAGARMQPPSATTAVPAGTVEEANEAVVEVRLVFQPFQTPDPGTERPEATDSAQEVEWLPVGLWVGEPS